MALQQKERQAGSLSRHSLSRPAYWLVLPPAAGELVALPDEPAVAPEPLEEPFPDPVADDAAGVVLTGCIEGTGAPLCSEPPETAGILGTGAPDVRKLEGRPDDDLRAIRSPCGDIQYCKRNREGDASRERDSCKPVETRRPFGGLVLRRQGSVGPIQVVFLREIELSIDG